MASQRLNSESMSFWRYYVGTIPRRDEPKAGVQNRSNRSWSTSKFSELATAKRPFFLFLRLQESTTTLNWWRHGSPRLARTGAIDEKAESELSGLLAGTAAHPLRFFSSGWKLHRTSASVVYPMRK